jgi:hypothetical protein
MKCPHCSKSIHFEDEGDWLYEYREPSDEIRTGYEISHGFCPACENLIVIMRDGTYIPTITTKDNSVIGSHTIHAHLKDIQHEEILYPKGFNRPIEPEVPEKYANEYRESASVQSISPKASAAISRRLLQRILREECNIKASSLAKEIDQFINKEGIPSYLVDAIDAIRNIGNFAAHPLKDTNTGEIVEVEEGEADWLLEVLDALFDFIFVQPTKLKERKKRLNKKLKSIGKPSMKSAKEK